MFESLELDGGVAVEIAAGTDGNYTIASVQISNQINGTVEGLGVAKKHPNDEEDLDFGTSLAIARAFKDLGEAFEQSLRDSL